MTEQSMIERVARAIGDWDSGRAMVLDANDCRQIARAALEALREPTEGMLLPGAETLPDYDPGCDDAKNCWQAMIDAALSEKPQ
jgi:hypothetical protein